MRTTWICDRCDSKDITVTADMLWNEHTQKWECQEPSDLTGCDWCNTCGDQTTATEIELV